MRYREILPSPALAGFVRCYWTLTAAPAAGPPALERVLPDGCVELIVHAGAPFERHDERRGVERQPLTFVVGPTTRHLMIRPTGEVRVLGIRFLPGGAHRFLAAPAHELADRALELDAVSRLLGADIGERVAVARSDAEVVRLVEGLLLRAAGDDDERGRVIRRAAAYVVRASDDFSMRALSSRVGLGQRHLERRFREVIGIGPKALQRISRFQRVVRAIERGSEPRWPELALRCGYYDQAHLTRDFRELSGTTPAAFARQHHEMSDHFTGTASESDSSKT